MQLLILISGLSMKKNKTIKTVFLVLIVTVPISGCALIVFWVRSTPSVTHMIPSFNHTTFVSTDKTLMVAEVKGGWDKKHHVFYHVSQIESEGFHEALTNTLKGSGIFKEVFTAEKGDYEIYAEIISQELKTGFTFTSTLFINYRLIEADSGKELWKENILSQYDVKFKEAFFIAPGGPDGKTNSNEGTVRDNLTQLIKKLSNVLSKLNKK